MTPVVLASVVLAMSSPGVPPPVDQIGARCEAAVYASDQLICGDPVLRSIDEDNVRRSSALQRLQFAADGHFESSEVWFRRRSRCAFEASHRACLVDAYKDRAGVLNLAATVGAAPQPMRCKGNWARERIQVFIAADGALLLTGTGKILAVATPPVGNSAWKPAVAFTQKGRTLVFEPLGAAPINCKLTPQSTQKE